MKYPKQIAALLAKKKEDPKSLTSEEQKQLDDFFDKVKNKRNQESKGFKPGNDFSWWSKVPTLLNDAVNVKSNWLAGTPIDVNEVPYIVPGVLRVKYERVFGNNKRATDPVNVWSRDLYLKMFSKYRGISAYTAADIFMFVLAELEAVAMIAKLERIYGVINRYSKSNLNIPTAEVRALGLTQSEANDIRNHLSDFRYDLNVLIRKAQRLMLPKDISLIANDLSLLAFEYLDHENVKGQIIIFDRTTFGIFSDTHLSTGGSVMFTPISSSNPLIDISNTVNMFPFLNTMLDAILGSEGNRKIMGDFLVWFGEDQMLQFLPLDENYLVIPTYSETMLHKLHNLELVPQVDPVGGGGFILSHCYNNGMTDSDKTALKNDENTSIRTIYQYMDDVVTDVIAVDNISSGTLIWGPYEGGNWYIPGTGNGNPQLHYDHAGVLDTYRVEVSPEVITEGVLWKNYIHKVSIGENKYGFPIEGCAFEIITALELYVINPNDTELASRIPVSTVSSTSNQAKQMAGSLAIIDWAPISYYIQQGRYSELYGDIDTPVVMHPNTLFRIHQAIIYSGLQTDVKVIGK